MKKSIDKTENIDYTKVNKKEQENKISLKKQAYKHVTYKQATGRTVQWDEWLMIKNLFTDQGGDSDER